jgi:PAS domain S-box-containing protein
VLDITNDVIWQWDIATGQVYNNKNHEKIFGYRDGQEGSVDSWIARLHKEDAARVKNSIMGKLANRDTTAWKEEYRFMKANGEVAYVVDTGILILDKDGQPVRMVGSIHDITERKISENEREKVIRELTESIRDLKQFSFITSHNLRAPLANILGILNVFDTSTLSDTNRELLNFLRITTLQLEETIKDLTSIIVIRNNVQHDKELISLPGIFETTRKVYLNSFNDIPYTIQANFGVEEAYINKSYLESIFTNLLSNAIKYRSRERPLVIGISTVLCGDDYFEILFSDNGQGLNTKRLQSRIFGMYQRFHANVEGKGLGLFMVKSQVTAMGGTIKMEGEENKGCIITIVLPLKRDLRVISANNL